MAGLFALPIQLLFFQKIQNEYLGQYLLLYHQVPVHINGGGMTPGDPSHDQVEIHNLKTPAPE